MKRAAFEPVATPLEDEVPVTFQLVGSQQWFDNDFEPGAVWEAEKIVISNPVHLQPLIARTR